jgi:ABC-type arginine transport system permease subunit
MVITDNPHAPGVVNVFESELGCGDNVVEIGVERRVFMFVLTTVIRIPDIGALTAIPQGTAELMQSLCAPVMEIRAENVELQPLLACAASLSGFETCGSRMNVML